MSTLGAQWFQQHVDSLEHWHLVDRSLLVVVRDALLEERYRAARDVWQQIRLQSDYPVKHGPSLIELLQEPTAAMEWWVRPDEHFKMPGPLLSRFLRSWPIRHPGPPFTTDIREVFGVKDDRDLTEIRVSRERHSAIWTWDFTMSPLRYHAELYCHSLYVKVMTKPRPAREGIRGLRADRLIIDDPDSDS